MSYIVVLTSDEMGHNNQSSEIGAKLMNAFLHKLTEQPEMPTHVLLYNSAVWLNKPDAPTVEDLKIIADKGVKLLTCGTCMNYFEQDQEQLPVGEVGNMGQFIEIMREAERIVQP